MSLARWVVVNGDRSGLDLSLNLVLPDNYAAWETLPPSQTFLSALNKVMEVPFGSHLPAVLPPPGSCQCCLGNPRQVLCWVFPLLVIDHVVAMFSFVYVLSH